MLFRSILIVCVLLSAWESWLICGKVMVVEPPEATAWLPKSFVSKLMLAAFLLAASSGGIAWGQAYISGPAGVQNTFGAGESARLNNGTVIFPGGGTWTGSEIEIATGSGNIVINSYNAGGRYTDYTNKWIGN